MENNLENAVLSNLEILKSSVKKEQMSTENEEKKADPEESILIEELQMFENIVNTNFDFESHRYFFDDIYFQNSKLIKYNSKEYNDFWSFLRKYQSLMKRKPKNADNNKSTTTQYSSKFNLPLKYNKRWRLNFVYHPNKTHMTTYDALGNSIKLNVTEDQFNEFEFILHLYLDFCQKEKFRKLKQLRESQSNLPIYKYHDTILETIKNNQITIIAGDTGCGKSTQLPRYLLEAGYDRIACTQPRRIACMSLAKRVGYETLNEFKSEVAFQVRFDKTRTKFTKILFLTEGVLLRQLQTDPTLSQYNFIVVDEVHERHVFTDFLLGILKCLIKQRTDLKIILMSATINIDLFSNYFDQCVIVKIPGRTFKIDVEFIPIVKDKDPKSKSNKLDVAPYIRLMQLIDKKYPENERGDMLIFLSGLSDIQSLCDAAKEYAAESKRWVILPLHSTLSIEDQDKVFDIPPEGVRKCILSTNIAETSITIDGLRFIVDSGKVKEISYDPKYKMQRLQEFWISRASAEQRKGRAGRTGPGVCFRLYSESDYINFNEFTTPEIKRVPLNSLLLQMIAMGLKDVRKFPFIEPPTQESIEHSLLFLKEQGALDEKEELTSMGKMLADLPVDIQIGKMLIMASMYHIIEPIVIMAAALSVQSPFLSNLKCGYETMQLRKDLISDHGDPLTLLNAYNEWIQLKATHGNSSRWAKKRGLEEQRFYEISKLKKQFYELLEDNHLIEKNKDYSTFESDEEDDETKAHSYSGRKNEKYEKILEKKERKRLLDLKRQLVNKPKKPKLLSLDDMEIDSSNLNDSDREINTTTDLRDIEFQLMHNLNDLQNKTLNCQKFSLRELNLLKIILTCGLYPQVAISDEFNSYKRDSDQCFHSKHKFFVVLHPTSIFAYDPDILQPPDDGVVEGKLRYSTRHQLLAYVNLFETNKAYFMNCMRFPALQTLLLYARSLDTNAECTRILCDSWLEIRFLDVIIAQKIISAIISLRTSIDKLFKIRLEERSKLFVNLNDKDNDEELEFASISETKRRKERAKILENILKKKLTEFLDSSVLYSLRRVLPAELNTIYIKNYVTNTNQNIGDENLFKQLSANSNNLEPKINESKGGYRITEYLNYNCLASNETLAIASEYSGMMQRHWKCPNCTKEFIFNLKERMQHEVTCQMNNDNVSNEEEKSLQKKAAKSANDVEYYCSICKETLYLNSIEILKHKKSHTN